MNNWNEVSSEERVKKDKEVVILDLPPSPFPMPFNFAPVKVEKSDPGPSTSLGVRACLNEICDDKPKSFSLIPPPVTFGTGASTTVPVIADKSPFDFSAMARQTSALALQAGNSSSVSAGGEQKLSKSQKKRRARKAALLARLSSVPSNSCNSTPIRSGAVDPPRVESAPMRAGKRKQADLSSSDPIRAARPQQKRPRDAAFGGSSLLFVMVVRKDAPDGEFSLSERAALENHINEVFLSDPRSVNGLRWSQSSGSSYALQYDCFSLEAFEWLADTLENVGELWPGCRLKFFSKTSMPKLTNLFVFFPGPELPARQAFSVLEKYNRVSTYSWRVYQYRSENQPRGLTLRIGVDNASLETLKESNFRLQYRFFGYSGSDKTNQ